MRVIELEISRFPCKERPYMPGSQTTQGRSDTRADVSAHVAFHETYGVGTLRESLSRLDGWPIRSPADASPISSRISAQGSGPMWFATPSLQRTFTVYSLPVSRRTSH
jgi:hypothetical protein